MIGRTRGVSYAHEAATSRRWMAGPHLSEGAGWLALDEIVDPQNLGSLCRTSRFLGASVLVSAKNSAPLSAAASKASAGAIEEAPVYAVPNLPRALEEAKAQGWRVLGAGVGDKQRARIGFGSYTMPSVLVVGSEGEGLRTTVRRACDALVQVGSAPDNSGVDSLNVGVAGAILLHHLLGGSPKLSFCALRVGGVEATGLHGSPGTYGPVFY